MSCARSAAAARSLVCSGPLTSTPPGPGEPATPSPAFLVNQPGAFEVTQLPAFSVGEACAWTLQHALSISRSFWMLLLFGLDLNMPFHPFLCICGLLLRICALVSLCFFPPALWPFILLLHLTPVFWRLCTSPTLRLGPSCLDPTPWSLHLAPVFWPLCASPTLCLGPVQEGLHMPAQLGTEGCTPQGTHMPLACLLGLWGTRQA